ncbi:aminopeptidase P family protein [Mucilaginibacter glaciei]|uniref:Xaa-Pro aminopeptidase n=1 Tax=Mucilaginibacter glaciei TaxID=2772109 RepID=A0A926NZ92_9SPHI|nr:aminopeptidase P family protein [Mucilaginibacter glaciei]MBD1394399.1 aminopeptidase P family protein [Mucilaginibacter glaciei]
MKLFNKILLHTAHVFTVAFTVNAQTVLQEKLPTDYLNASFHAGRRQALRDKMPPNSVAVVFAYPEQVFSNDVNYVYHQNPDLYYFSGYKEPNSLLLIFKEMQNRGNAAYNEVLFVQKRDAAREQWTGKRLGVEGAKATLGFKEAYNSDEFAAFPIDLKKFSKILYNGIPANTGTDASKGSLSNLVEQFKLKASIKAIDAELMDDLNFINLRATPKNINRLITYLTPKMERDVYKNNPILQQLIAKPDSATLIVVKSKINAEIGGPSMYDDFVTQLRGVKTAEEMVLLKKSVVISSLAHAEAMRAVTPTMSERELEGIMLYVHKRYGAEDEGYPPIVGAGGNGCILHYEENSATAVQNQLVLMDVGAEYHGYSADVTRTFPANGKFTEAQKAIYQLVYDAQEEVFKLCKEGVPYTSLETKTREVLTAGLIKLGIITGEKELSRYYPHGVSHHLGLDVHDRGAYGGNLMENMMITVEPGIYIPAGSPCDKKWWNIGVRIEDDIQIGKDKGTNLSADAPRKWQDVEKMVAEKSLFDAGKFPVLK